jgi:hypothetical protein
MYGGMVIPFGVGFGERGHRSGGPVAASDQQLTRGMIVNEVPR